MTDHATLVAFLTLKLDAMPVYPKKVLKRCESLSRIGVCENADGVSRAANFSCGCFVGFSLEVSDAKIVSDARFISNGCGYMVASADVLANLVARKSLADLHSLNEPELVENIRQELDDFPADRKSCVDSVTEALRTAFADYRKRRIEEFRGEKALICTCFGVMEETIEQYIEDSDASSVEDVTRACRAGGGCGSCVMLIHEMLDAKLRL